MNVILKQLTEIKTKLYTPLPTSDINKICEDFRYYYDNIAGTLSYVLGDMTNQIPQNQIDMLYKSFFECYNQYDLLEGHIANYHYFLEEYKSFKQARKLLLQLLSNNHSLLNPPQKIFAISELLPINSELHKNRKRSN